MIKKFIKNEYLFSLFTKFISVGVGIIYSVLYSRYLGAELRGTASIITNYSEILSIILTFGAFNAYPYFKKRDDKDIYENFVNNVFGLFFLYCFLALFISVFFHQDLNIMIAILIAPFWMCSRQLNYVVLIENPRLSNITNTSIDIFDLFFVFVLMLTTHSNLKWCISIVTVKHIVLFAICVVNINRVKFKFKPTLKGIWPYIKYGIVPMITMLLMEINYKMDVIMLEWFNISTAEIGIYSLGVMLAQKVLLIPDALKDILLSKLVSGKGADEVAKICRISFFVTFICVFFLLIFGKQLITIMYGIEFLEAYSTTVIICAGVIGMVFYKMVYSYNVVNGYKNVNLMLLGMSALLNIVANIFLIPLMNSTGAAIASLISYLFCGISFMIFFMRKTKINLNSLLFINNQDVQFVKEFFNK